MAVVSLCFKSRGVILPCYMGFGTSDFSLTANCQAHHVRWNVLMTPWTALSVVLMSAWLFECISVRILTTIQAAACLTLVKRLETVKLCPSAGAAVGSDDGDKSAEKAPAISGSDEAWLGKLVEMIWPRVDIWFHKLMIEKIQPQINDRMPTHLQGCIVVKEATLGQVTPKFKPLTVRKREDDVVVLDIGFTLESQMSLNLTAGRFVELGAQELSFKGALSVVFRPQRDVPPFFGGIEIYFVNPPQIDLDFTGVANIADCPGFHGIVRGIISDALNSQMTIPARIAVDLNDEDDTEVADMRFPEPLGILRLTLISAEDLNGADLNLGSVMSLPRRIITADCPQLFTPDPYVIVSLGQQKWTSETISATASPDWTPGTSDPKNDNVVDFPVYERAQKLRFAVYDGAYADMMGTGASGALLGEVQKKVAELFTLSSSGKSESSRSPCLLDHELALKEKKKKPAGTIKVRTQWLRLKPISDPEEDNSKFVSGPNQLFFQAKLCNAVDVPTRECTPPYRVCVRIGDEDDIVANKDRIGEDGRQGTRSTYTGDRQQVAYGASGKRVFMMRSTPGKPQTAAKEIAQEQACVCQKLAKTGLKPGEIAWALGMKGEHVAEAIRPESSQDNTSVVSSKIGANYSARHPIFEQILNINLPWPEMKAAYVVLEVIDATGRVVGTSKTIQLFTVMCNSDSPGKLKGPFSMYNSETSGKEKKAASTFSKAKMKMSSVQRQVTTSFRDSKSSTLSGLEEDQNLEESAVFKIQGELKISRFYEDDSNQGVAQSAEIARVLSHDGRTSTFSMETKAEAPSWKTELQPKPPAPACCCHQ